jgi:DNA repair exonuclease SbcCD nuclease subunit
MRFLHTADWQLGMTRHFLAGDAQPQYSAARREAVAGLGQLAVETGAEFVVVAGDVFDSNQLAPEVVGKSLQAMRAIGIPVYLLPGNHDPLDAGSVYTSPLFKAECPDNVVVLDREGPWDLRPGVQLVAAPWRSKRPTTDLVAAVLEDLPTDGTIRVLVAHGGVDALDPNAEAQAIIRLSGVTQAIEGGAVHYVALGDKHSRTRVDDAGRVWYPGSPEVTNYDDREPDPGHVLIVDIAEDDPAHPVTVEARHVGRWRFTTVRRQLDNRVDIDEFDRELDLMPDKERTVVRHGLSGTLTVTDRAALDDCLERHARWFAWIGPWERHSDLAVMPAAGEFDDLGLSGFAAAALDELVDTAQTGNSAEAQDAQGALALLLRLVRGSGA